MSEDARRAARLAALSVLALVGAGVVAIRVIERDWLQRWSLFYEQFARFEPMGMAIIGVFAIAVLWMLQLLAPDDTSGPPPRWLEDSLRTRARIALAVIVIAVMGTKLVFHEYIFVDDEYSGWFQAVIYSRGLSGAPVPEPWCQWIASMTPTSIGIQRPCTWNLNYLPVHSMVRGAFIALRMDILTEPTLAALSVLLVIAIARRAWPERPDRAILAGLYLAAATQVLFMSMTGFAMIAHLFATLLWLWFYVHPARWALVLLPWVGVVALGVHSPYPHALAVLPFLARFVLQRRWVASVYIAAVYLLGIAFWQAVISPGLATETLPVVGAGAVAGQMAAVAGRQLSFNGLTNVMSLTLLTTWSVPVAMIAMVTAFVTWHRLDGFSRWLALSVLCTLGVRALFFGIQGAGWGYRFAFAILGNIAMLAAVGTEIMASALGSRRTYRLIAAALLVAVVVQLPMRGWQAERIVRPFYETSRWLAAQPVQIVIIDPTQIRYARQLIRNDPFLRHPPVIMDGSALGEAGIAAVQRAFPGQVKVVTEAELIQFGVGR